MKALLSAFPGAGIVMVITILLSATAAPANEGEAVKRSAEARSQSVSEGSRQSRAEKREARQMQKRLKAVPKHWWGATVALGIRYSLFAGGAWLMGYVLFRKRWLPRKIVQAFPNGKAVRRELWYSARTMIIFGLVGALTIFFARQGWTQMYWDISRLGYGWFAVSIVLCIVVHDAYFYWTHRLMHHRRLFRWFHRGHHLSHNPTPWAAYAFDPLEAVVQSAIFPLMVFLFPLHPFAFGLFMLWQITFNVAGHTGYEFHPRWLMDSWLGKFLNTPTNHAMHHETMRGNYGLYFNYWDRLMGTNHEDYERRFREVTHRGGR